MCPRAARDAGYSAIMHDEGDERAQPNPDPSPDPDAVAAVDDPSLTEYDKTIADSFPASDPPAQP